jgi:hypothetical protein
VMITRTATGDMPVLCLRKREQPCPLPRAAVLAAPPTAELWWGPHLSPGGEGRFVATIWDGVEQD